MNKSTADELERRAGSMHPSTSKYFKLIVQRWLESGKKVTLWEG